MPKTLDKFLVRKCAAEEQIDERTLTNALLGRVSRHKTFVGERIARAKAAYEAAIAARGGAEASPEPTLEDAVGEAASTDAAPASPTPEPTPDPAPEEAPMEVTNRYPHTLDIAEVVRRAKIAFADYGEKYADAHPRVVWTSDTTADVTFEAIDQTWLVRFTVLADEIVVSADVHPRFEPIASLAVGKIGEELDGWLKLTL